MTQVKTLNELDLETLSKQFPSGRIINFEATTTPNKFSLKRIFLELLERIGLYTKIPDWVQQNCQKVQDEKSAEGLIGGIIKVKTLNGDFIDTPNERNVIIARSVDGSEMIAILLNHKPIHSTRAWLVATWNTKTGEALPFPI